LLYNEGMITPRSTLIALLASATLTLGCGGGEPAAAAACASNTQCPAGQYCGAGGVCTFDCTLDKDCPGGACSSLGKCVGGAVGVDAGTPPADLGTSPPPALDAAVDGTLAADAAPAKDASGPCQSATQWSCTGSFWQECTSTCGTLILECYGDTCYCYRTDGSSFGGSGYKQCPAPPSPPGPPGSPSSSTCAACEAAIGCCQGL
jgi:hypothetical protein